MKFTGPGTIYIQSKNLNDLFSLISQHISTKQTKSNVTGNLIENAFNLFADSDGGSKKKTRRKKKN